MADGLYIGMTGAAARAEQLDAVADNLANAQTPGFKAARVAFESFLPSGGAKDKVYPAAVAAGTDMRPGGVTHTGNPLDVAMEGEAALLAVQQPSGQTAFTRAGRLSVDPQGRLLAVGHPVLDRQGNPILIPPETTPAIAADGRVLANGTDVGRVGIFRIDGPVSRLGAQLLAPGDGAKVVPVDGGKVRVGELELGNFSPLEATVQLVSTQRNYETSMQALQTYKRLDDRIVEVGRIR
jgi:flagellar basal-body rod protein FlgF